MIRAEDQGADQSQGVDAPWPWPARPRARGSTWGEREGRELRERQSRGRKGRHGSAGPDLGHTSPLPNPATQSKTNELARPPLACRTGTAPSELTGLQLTFTEHPLGLCRCRRHPNGTKEETEAKRKSHCSATQLNTVKQRFNCT